MEGVVLLANKGKVGYNRVNSSPNLTTIFALSNSTQIFAAFGSQIPADLP